MARQCASDFNLSFFEDEDKKPLTDKLHIM